MRKPLEFMCEFLPVEFFPIMYLFFMHRIQLGQPATVKVAANLVRLLAYNNKVGAHISLFKSILIKNVWIAILDKKR